MLKPFGEHFFDVLEVLLFALALAAGAMGGCTVAGYQIIRDKGQLRRYLIFAYAVIGAFFGGAIYIVASHIYLYAHSTIELLSLSMICGFLGTLVLSATNLSAKFILRRLGIEVVVDVRRTKREDCDDHRPRD